MKLFYRFATLIFLGIMIFALAACTPRSSGSGSPNLANTEWTLVSMGKPGAEQPAVSGAKVTLKLEDGGRAGGSGGCNSYGGSYQIQGDQIKFENVNATLMACADENAMQQETQYFHALQTAGKVEQSGNSLKIYYDDGNGVLNFSKTAGS